MVQGDQTRLSLAGDLRVRELTPTLDGRLLGACGYWLVEVGKADEPMKRTITKAQRPATSYAASLSSRQATARYSWAAIAAGGDRVRSPKDRPSWIVSTKDRILECWEFTHRARLDGVRSKPKPLFIGTRSSGLFPAA